MSKVKAGRRGGVSDVLTYPLDAILTAAEVAVAFKVHEKTIARMDLPHVDIGHRTIRYVWGQVVEAMRERAAARLQQRPNLRR